MFRFPPVGCLIMANLDVETVVERAEKAIGYTFQKKELLLEALTHSSFTNEMKVNKRNHYERSEFLGDAVLELYSSEFLFYKYPEDPEGKLSKTRASMVCEPSLAICARKMGLGELIFFGKGEEAAGGREKDSILSDVVEAILGAVFLDGGTKPSKAYVHKHILEVLDSDDLFVDYKTKLQEWLQKQGHNDPPVYQVISESGPEHDKIFEVRVSFADKVLAVGKGRTKKAASQDAALHAVQSLVKDFN